MTAYYDEPKSVAQMLSRYREVRRRLYPPVIRPATRDFTARDAENTITLVLALTAVAAVRARASQARAEETLRAVMTASRVRYAIRYGWRGRNSATCRTMARIPAKSYMGGSSIPRA
jgi:hypothetical protein